MSTLVWCVGVVLGIALLATLIIVIAGAMDDDTTSRGSG